MLEALLTGRLFIRGFAFPLFGVPGSSLADQATNAATVVRFALGSCALTEALSVPQLLQQFRRRWAPATEPVLAHALAEEVK